MSGRLTQLLICCALCLVQRAGLCVMSADVDERTVVSMLAPSRALAARGQLDAAEAALTDVMRQLESRFGSGHWSQAYALDDLARLQFQRKRLPEALQHVTVAEHTAEQAFGADSPRLAYFQGTHAFLAYAAGACDSAKERYAAAYEIYTRSEGNSGEHARRIAQALVNLMIITGSLQAAERLIARAFSSPDDRALALLLQASVLTSKGEFAMARGKLEEANRANQLRPKGPREELSRSLQLEGARTAFASSDLETASRLLDAMTPNRSAPEDLEALHQRALIDGVRGRFAEAQSEYVRVIAGYSNRFTELAPPVATAHYNLAWTYRLLGDYSRSLIHFQKALAGAQACMGAESAFAAAIYMERSALYRELGRLSEALADAEHARNISRTAASNPILEAYAIAVQGYALKRIGRLDEANARVLEALQILRAQEGPDASDLAPGFVALAEIALLRQNFAATGQFAAEALRIRRLHAAESFWGSGIPLSLLAASSAAQGQWQDYWQNSAALRNLTLKRLQIGPSSSELVSRELRNSRELIERVLDAMPQDPARAEHARDLFLTLQLPHLGALSSVSAGLIASAATRQPALQNILKERARLLEEMQAVRARLDTAMLQTPLRQSSALLDEQLANLARLEGRLVAIGDELQKRAPDTAALVSPSIESAEVIAAAIGPKAAVYLHVVTEQATYGALVSREGVFIKRSGVGRAALRRNISTLRRGLDLATPLAQRVPFDPAVAQEVYRSTIGQFAKQLEGKSELFVLADDALQSLPFGVLVLTADQPTDGWQPGSFLIEHCAITVLPSLGALRKNAVSGASKSRLPFIGFGNPVLSGVPGGSSRSSSSVATAGVTGITVDDLNSLTPLPETDEELRELAKALFAAPNTINTQSLATETAVKAKDLTPYRVISFATHGLMAGEFRGNTQPGLVLTPPRVASPLDDGLLTASEVVQLNLDADLVLLAACNTGRDDTGGGAIGVSALTRAFVYAGARTVVVSHWAVSSRATVKLLTAAIERMSKPGVTKSAALQQAMIRLLRGEEGEQFRQPAYWAPFVLVGDSTL